MKKRDEKYVAAVDAIRSYLSLFDPADEVSDTLDKEADSVDARLVSATYAVEAAVRKVASL